MRCTRRRAVQRDVIERSRRPTRRIGSSPIMSTCLIGTPPSPRDLPGLLAWAYNGLAEWHEASIYAFACLNPRV
jgi:hypothetical protein